MQPALQPLPNGLFWLLLWGCRLFRNGSLCGQGQLEQRQVYVESLLIMRTALAVRVAATAKWIFVAVLVLVVVLERRSLSSRAAGTSFARPVPQPESRRIDLPEQGQVYVESLLIMRTALAASVAAAAKWTFVAAPLGLQAVPERQSVWSRAAGTSFARPVSQPESRRIDLPERGASLC